MILCFFLGMVVDGFATFKFRLDVYRIECIAREIERQRVNETQEEKKYIT